MKETFSPENFNKLIETCEKIINISNENVDGALMFSQLEMLGSSIKEFKENPIVKNSGI